MKNILILHIPKTAGNSIQKYLIKKDNLNVFGINHRIQNASNGGTVKNFKKDGTFKNAVIGDINNYFKITVIRNPYDRLVSLFHFQKGKIDSLLACDQEAREKYGKPMNELDLAARTKLFDKHLSNHTSGKAKVVQQTNRSRESLIHEKDTKFPDFKNRNDICAAIAAPPEATFTRADK